MRAADYLKLVELEPEHPARVLHQRPDAQGAGGGPRVQGRRQVPDLDLAVVGAGHDPLGVEADAADQLLVALQDPQAGPALDVPEPDGVVRGAADHQAVVVLETSDPPLVAVESASELAGGGVPDLDGPVPGGADDVLLIEVHHVDGGPVSDQHAPEVDFGRGDHVPDGYGPVLGAGDHHAAVEPEVENGLAVVDQRVHHLARVDVPDTNLKDKRQPIRIDYSNQTKQPNGKNTPLRHANNR